MRLHLESVPAASVLSLYGLSMAGYLTYRLWRHLWNSSRASSPSS